jgi:hypothetical protein
MCVYFVIKFRGRLKNPGSGCEMQRDIIRFLHVHHLRCARREFFRFDDTQHALIQLSVCIERTLIHLKECVRETWLCENFDREKR